MSDAPFSNSGGLLNLLTNGLAGAVSGLRITRNSLPTNTNVLELDLGVASGEKDIEVRVLDINALKTHVKFRGLVDILGTTGSSAGALVLRLGDLRVMQFGTSNAVQIGQFSAAGVTIGSQASEPLCFWGGTPTVKPTGVAVTAEAIHAALVTIGLIGA